ncbi:NDR1/HIN1-like protein 3 [Rutidosis leptorrhynchoides]|uniref:NDR1/HIN1-like protein 3 n=1 Tax=Rutidosis leptorrhynchoides TaxID=125765 RepID=UPI003A98FFDB
MLDPYNFLLDDDHECISCRCCLLINMVWILILVLAAVDGNSQKVNVNDVTITQFMLSPTINTLYYNLAVNMTFRNTYKKLGIRVGLHVDIKQVDLMYQGQRLGTKEVLQEFYLKSKREKSNVTAVLRGEQLLQLINGDERFVYESQS